MANFHVVSSRVVAPPNVAVSVEQQWSTFRSQRALYVAELKKWCFGYLKLFEGEFSLTKWVFRLW